MPRSPRSPSDPGPLCDGADETDETAAEEPVALPPVDVWLVDGFNVLHAVMLGGEDRGRFWDRSHREKLIERLGRGLESSTPIVVVFDGHRPVEGDAARPAPTLEVVFAPSADDWIVKRARQASRAPDEAGEANGGGLVGVVSNDRQVAGRCRHAGAEVVGPGAFMAQLMPGNAEPAEPDDEVRRGEPRRGDTRE